MRKLGLVWVLALAPAVCAAAQLYAAVPGGLNVYRIGDDGSLVFRQTLPSGSVRAMAATPGGRFLYTTDGLTISQYAVQADGTVAPFGAAVTVPGFEATGDLAIHPTTGDYLYTVATTMNAFRTDDADGHLSLAGSTTVMTDGFRMAVHPGGEYVFALAGERGSVVTVKTNPDGTLAGRTATLGLPGLATGAIAADTRFVYIGTVPFEDEDPAKGQLLVLRVQPDGNLVPLTTTNGYATRLQTIADLYLAVSAGGLGSNLLIYSTDALDACGGGLRLADQAPIEVFALAKGTGKWARNLWVATTDGIVTYSLGSDGKLARISKAFVNGATLLTFGAR